MIPTAYLTALSDTSAKDDLLTIVKYEQMGIFNDEKSKLGLLQYLATLMPRLDSFQFRFASVFGNELKRVLTVDCGFALNEDPTTETNITRMLEKVGRTYRITSFQLLEAFSFALKYNPMVLTPYRNVSTRFFSEVILYWQDNRISHILHVKQILAALAENVNSVHNKNMATLKEYCSSIELVVTAIVYAITYNRLPVVDSPSYTKVLYGVLVSFGELLPKSNPHPYQHFWDEVKDIPKISEEKKVYLSQTKIILTNLRLKYLGVGVPDVLFKYHYTEPCELDDEFKTCEMSVLDMRQRYGESIVTLFCPTLRLLLESIDREKSAELETDESSLGARLKAKINNFF